MLWIPRHSLSRAAAFAFALAVAAPSASASTDTFPIGFNQVVSNGVSGQGTGNIEVNGEVDVYTFDSPANQTVFFNEIGTNNCSLTWILTDPTDQVIFNQQLGQCGPDAGTLVLAAAGTHTLTVQIPNGIVNAADLAILLGAWNTRGPSADLNVDSTVDATDLAILLGEWTG